MYGVYSQERVRKNMIKDGRIKVNAEMTEHLKLLS